MPDFLNHVLHVIAILMANFATSVVLNLLAIFYLILVAAKLGINQT